MGTASSRTGRCCADTSLDAPWLDLQRHHALMVSLYDVCMGRRDGGFVLFAEVGAIGCCLASAVRNILVMSLVVGGLFGQCTVEFGLDTER